MPGINEINNVTIENITNIINLTSGDPTEFFINVNNVAYGGWLFFILLCVLGFILYRRAQDKEDQPMINLMNVTTVLTVLSFFLRAVYIVKDGVQQGLLTDFQMWIFPLLAVFFAMINRYIADR